eukprot:g23747.t1
MIYIVAKPKGRWIRRAAALPRQAVPRASSSDCIAYSYYHSTVTIFYNHFKIRKIAKFKWRAQLLSHLKPLNSELGACVQLKFQHEYSK